MGQIGSGKVFTHSSGYSCAFRQWTAESHCSFLHGYALKIELQFVAILGLDKDNWVWDFGGLKEVKEWLATQFDHKTVVAQDEPYMRIFKHLHEQKVLDLVVLDKVGCEAFAAHIADWVQRWLFQHPNSKSASGHVRVRLNQVTVWEHESNYAYWRYDPEAPDAGKGVVYG